jgi:hypothetical protein
MLVAHSVPIQQVFEHQGSLFQLESLRSSLFFEDASLPAGSSNSASDVHRASVLSWTRLPSNSNTYAPKLAKGPFPSPSSDDALSWLDNSVGHSSRVPIFLQGRETNDSDRKTSLDRTSASLDRFAAVS